MATQPIGLMAMRGDAVVLHRARPTMRALMRLARWTMLAACSFSRHGSRPLQGSSARSESPARRRWTHETALPSVWAG